MTTASGEPHPAAGVADMIDFAYAQDFNKATEIFNDLIGDKMSSALDQEKIAVADQIFNDQEETDDEEAVEVEASAEAEEAEDGEAAEEVEDETEEPVEA